MNGNARYCRAAARSNYSLGGRDIHIGLRLLRIEQ